MEIPSATPSITSTKTKSKTSSTKPEKTASGEKKPAAPRRKKATAAEPPIAAADVQIVAQRLQQNAGAGPDEQAVFLMIATAAYYRAEQRNFAPGHDFEDWLEAEREVRASFR